MSIFKKLFWGLSLIAVLGAADLVPAAESASRSQPDRLVISCKGTNSLVVLDAETGKHLGSVRTGVSPHEVVVTSDRKRAVVSIYGSGIYGDNPNPNNQLGLIDLENMTEDYRLDLGKFKAPHGLAVAEDGRIWVTVEENKSVLLVDPTKRAVVASVPVGAPAHYIVLSPDDRWAYTSNKQAKFISVIDTQRREATERIDLPRGAQGIAVSPDGKRLYVGDFDRHLLQVVDTGARRRIKEIQLQAQSGWVHVTHDSKRVLVSTYDQKKNKGFIEFFSTESLESEGVVPVESEPFHMTSTTDGRYAFVALGDGSIAKIDTRLLKIVSTFVADEGAERIILLEE